MSDCYVTFLFQSNIDYRNYSYVDKKITVYNISSETAYQIKPNLAGMVLGSHFEIMSKMAAFTINELKLNYRCMAINTFVDPGFCGKYFFLYSRKVTNLIFSRFISRDDVLYYNRAKINSFISKCLENS